MERARSRRLGLVLAAVGLGALGCGRSGGGGSWASSTVALPAATSTASTTSTPSSRSTALPAPPCVPLIVVHGHGGDPAGLLPFVERYGRGRVVVKEIYALEADALKAGDLPLACVVNAGYYREGHSSPLYDPDANGRGQGSIGGCSTPRSDGLEGLYPISYAARLARIVDGVRRASGSDRVDLACHSMGNLVGRTYVRWHSDLGTGTSKVRKLFMVAGPQRGIDAVEALIDGLENSAGSREFMIQGENMEMCQEYDGWGGSSFVDHLNDGWDNFCSSAEVQYGGITGIGPYGAQVQGSTSTSASSSSASPSGASPSPSSSPKPSAPASPASTASNSSPSILSIFGVNLASLGLSGTLGAVAQALQSLSFATLGDTLPLWWIAVPHLVPEIQEALGPSDGTVRLASSRLDQPPFARTDFWTQFEGRHSGTWNVEQVGINSTFATELAREYLAQGGVAVGGQVSAANLTLVDSAGHASWLALETHVTGGPLVSAQLVEEVLDASGNPKGGAQGYACPVDVGDHTAMVSIPAGGGTRRYRVVLYDASGSVFSRSGIVLGLTDGTLEPMISTSVDSATPTVGALGTAVHVGVSSNAPAGDPTLEFGWRLDGAAWTAYAPAASLDTPPLGPGEHRLLVRARHAHNAAQVCVEDARGVEVGLFVDAAGGLTLRR